MKELKIQVARLNGELFFAAQGIYLGFLAPHDFDFKASFTVTRDNKVVETGDVLDFSNVHRRMPGFLIRGRSDVDLVADDLEPDDFAEGDELIFTLRDAKSQAKDFKLGFAQVVVGRETQQEFDAIEAMPRETEEEDSKYYKCWEEYGARALRAAEEYVIPDGTVVRPRMSQEK